MTTPTDLSGGPRIIGASVDMGAFEFQLPNYVGIEIQPSSQNAPLGQTVVFNVLAASPLPLGYPVAFQWNKYFAGATNMSYSVTNVQTSDDGAYSVVVSNGLANVTSSNAILTVFNPVEIVEQPANELLLAGGNTSFTVSAGGTDLNYQWYFNGTPLVDSNGISGSATATLIITNVQASNGGNYNVLVNKSIFLEFKLQCDIDSDISRHTLQPSSVSGRSFTWK